jgi:thiamine-phosphate diphosphorylase
LRIEEAARQAVAGGARIVQLRDKQALSRALYDKALALREVTAQGGALFIVNDRADVALAAKADGVHVGQDDLPASVVRRIVGQEMIVGVSVATLEEARAAILDGADYLGVGPILHTTTKEISGATGVELLRRIRQETDLPLVAIGGIGLSNIGEVARAGAKGAAVISALMGAPDIQKAARELIAAFREGRGGGVRKA